MYPQNETVVTKLRGITFFIWHGNIFYLRNKAKAFCVSFAIKTTNFGQECLYVFWTSVCMFTSWLLLVQLSSLAVGISQNELLSHWLNFRSNKYCMLKFTVFAFDHSISDYCLNIFFMHSYFLRAFEEVQVPG